MKHTTTRKKMLLSSVAMLLVAMLALGSATFAWFTANPSSTADGLKMKTTSGTGLLVLSETEGALQGRTFSHETTLRAVAKTTAADGKVTEVQTNASSFELQPASLSNSAGIGETIGTFYTTDAKADHEYLRDTTKTATTFTPSTTGYVYAEKIYTKVTGGAANAAISLTSLNWAVPNEDYLLKDSVRVAVAGTDGKLVGIFATSADGNLYLTGATSISASNYTPIAKTDTITRTVDDTTVKGMDVGTATAAGDAYVTVYVYIDGEDTECYTNQCTGADVMQNLHVGLQITDTIVQD